MSRTELKKSESPVDNGENLQKSAKGAVTESHSFRDGKIYLYRRADYKKPTWLCRVKVPRGSGYVNRSTKTTDQHEAYAFADNLYNELLARSFSGKAANSKKVSSVIDHYIRRMEPDRSRLSVHNKILLIERLRPHLGKMTFEELSTASISRMIDQLSAESKKSRLSENSIKRILSDLKHFFRWCRDEGHLDEMPRFPKVSGKASRRPHFDTKDWGKLTRHLREFVKVENAKTRRQREMLRDYVLILANTGMRVGEARKLKWRDIAEIGGSDGHPPSIVFTVSGKTGKREVVATSADVKKYLKRLYELRKADLAEKESDKIDVDPDSFIFCHPDGSTIGSFKKSFSTLLRSAGIEYDGFGEPRTLYSLRHTYATFRLQHGVNHYSLAKNMGTSVAMIEQYYGHTTNADSAQELTKMSKRRSSRATVSLSWLD